jgi:hypothetical protein
MLALRLREPLPKSTMAEAFERRVDRQARGAGDLARAHHRFVRRNGG